MLRMVPLPRADAQGRKGAATSPPPCSDSETGEGDHPKGGGGGAARGGLAAIQRLRRAIMHENGRWTDVDGMRTMHNAAASHSIFIAANQRLWRAVMNENKVRSGIGGMRRTHKAAASHSIFIAVTPNRREATSPPPLVGVAGGARGICVASAKAERPMPRQDRPPAFDHCPTCKARAPRGQVPPSERGGKAWRSISIRAMRRSTG